MSRSAHTPKIPIRVTGFVLLGLLLACSPQGHKGTSDDGASATSASGTADQGSSADAGTAATSQGSASGPATSDGTGQTSRADATGGGSSAASASDGSTGLAGDCAQHRSQRDCEAAECAWVGDPRAGICVPDVEATEGDVCEPLGMQRCDAIPVCIWDETLRACVPV